MSRNTVCTLFEAELVVCASKPLRFLPEC